MTEYGFSLCGHVFSHVLPGGTAAGWRQASLKAGGESTTVFAPKGTRSAEGPRMYLTNISEAKAQLSALIEKVPAGEEVIICKAGKPVAKLVRYERSEEARRPGALEGKIKIADDFDELPPDIAEGFGITES